MKKNFHHGEHRGHGVRARGAGVEFLWGKKAIRSDAFKQLFFHSVISVSSVVKPLCFPLA
jgi:hypothetical protein